MFDISFFEIIVISMIALIVVGPERLPHVARTLGHLIGRCRQFVYSVKTDIHNEMRMEELKEMQHTMQESVHSIENSLQKEINEIKSTVPPTSQEKATDTPASVDSKQPETDGHIKNQGSEQPKVSDNDPASSP